MLRLVSKEWINKTSYDDAQNSRFQILAGVHLNLLKYISQGY